MSISLLSHVLLAPHTSVLAQTPQCCHYLSLPGWETHLNSLVARASGPWKVLSKYTSHELFMMWLISVIDPTTHIGLSDSYDIHKKYFTIISNARKMDIFSITINYVIKWHLKYYFEI